MKKSRKRTRIMLASLLVLLLLTGTSIASADGSPQKAATPVGHARAKPKTPPPEPKPAPDVKLVIDAPTMRGPWTMRVINAGDVPVRIAADASLLSLDVTARGARTPIRCELPDDMRASSDRERALVLPPKRSYAESFEPRLYCFAEKLDALAPGAVVVARLGWTAGHKTAEPFEVAPIEGIEPELASLKSIDAPPIALPDEPAASLAPDTAHPQDVDVDSPRLSLEGAPAVDAMSLNDIELPVTLRNESQRAVVVRFRPEVLAFDVIGPGGIERCAWPTWPGAALPELFTTLPPNGTDTLDLSLADYCTRGSALNREGLLVVRPRLDTRNASGLVVGLPSFDGTLVAMKPTVVRLHRGAAPVGPLRRPRIEDQ
jgi:hypothetical protein